MKIKLSISFLLILLIQLAYSQGRRFLINPGFESPVLGCASPNYSTIPETSVPGWVSSDAVSRSIINCGVPGANGVNLIELWTTNFNSIPSRSGSQFAEVNANINSGMYQELCLLPNEVVTFSIWHRKRTNDANRENLVVQLIDPATQTIVGTASAAHDAVFGSWTQYSGTVTNNGVQGIRRLGIFGSRLQANGTPGTLSQSVGNLIDDADIDLKPLVDAKRFTSLSTTEGNATQGNTNLEIMVSGNIKPGAPATVTINKSGTATYGTDYTIGTPTRGTVVVDALGNITLTLPAGDYDPALSTGTNAGIIAIPFVALTDAIADNNETVTYTINATSGGGGGNANLDLAFNIGGYSAGCSVRIGTASFSIFDAIIVLSGQLLNDADGFRDNTINGVGTNIGGTMFITVVNSSGNVIASKPVPPNGIYTFTNSEVPNGTYAIRIGTTLGTPGLPAPPASLPNGWVYTGEGTVPDGDGTPDGIIPNIPVNASAPVQHAFGIDQIPSAYPVSNNQPGAPRKIDFTSVAFQGSDPEQQPTQNSWAYLPIRISALPTNGFILKYNGVNVTVGQVIPDYDPALLTIEPGPTTQPGTKQTAIEYNIVDAAGKTSQVASYTLNFSEALPVIFGAIEAKLLGNSLFISWQTVQERSCDRFEIQASINGIDFKKIGEIKTKALNGNSEQLLGYEFTTALHKNIMAWSMAAFVIVVFLLVFHKKNHWILAPCFIISLSLFIASCDKNNNKLDVDYSKILIRVVQFDLDGTAHYSKIVKGVR